MMLHLATDHAGFEHKEALKVWLDEERIPYTDHGAMHLDPDDDFVDFITPAAKAVSQKPAEDKAIIFGGSGSGEAMRANQYPHVRAAVYYGGVTDIVSLSRLHNDANVLSIGARFVSVEDTLQAASLWLTTDFSNEPRHIRRIKKMNTL